MLHYGWIRERFILKFINICVCNIEWRILNFDQQIVNCAEHFCYSYEIQAKYISVESLWNGHSVGWNHGLNIIISNLKFLAVFITCIYKSSFVNEAHAYWMVTVVEWVSTKEHRAASRLLSNGSSQPTAKCQVHHFLQPVSSPQTG